MSYSYLGVKSTATDLLKKFGRQFTFTRKTDGSYNPNTGSSSTSSSTYQRYGAVFNYSDSERGEGTVQEGDRRILAEGHTYQIGDTVSIESENYRIISISNIQPGDTIVACNLQVRK